jgi:hypothetical protein
MKLTNEQRENMNQMQNNCRDYRGKFIHATVQLEALINSILSYYFAPTDGTKREELMYGIFSSERILMSHKVDLVKFVAEQHYKEFYDQFIGSILEAWKNLPKKEKRDKQPPYTLWDHLDEIVTFRNIFAHRPFLQTVESLDNWDGEHIEIDIKKIKDGDWGDARKLTMSDKGMNLIIQTMSLVHTRLEILHGQVKDTKGKNAKDTNP